MPAGRPPSVGWPRIDVIQEAICDLFGISQRALLSRRRAQSLVRARQAAFWLARQAGYSYPVIAQAFANRDHTTVIYGVSRAARMLDEDEDFSTAVEKLAAAVGCKVQLPM